MQSIATTCLQCSSRRGSCYISFIFIPTRISLLQLHSRFNVESVKYYVSRYKVSRLEENANTRYVVKIDKTAQMEIPINAMKNVQSHTVFKILINAMGFLFYRYWNKINNKIFFLVLLNGLYLWPFLYWNFNFNWDIERLKGNLKLNYLID